MSLNLPPLQKTTLSNGLKVVLAERHTAPVVNFTLMVDSGYSADPERRDRHGQLRRSACWKKARRRAIR